jgi:hypothetical protein
LLDLANSFDGGFHIEIATDRIDGIGRIKHNCPIFQGMTDFLDRTLLGIFRMERVNSSHDSKIVAYWDCPTGIAGDMCLGALVDLGVPLEYLIAQLKTLGIEDEYQLRDEKVHRRGQIATKVHVDVTAEKSDHHHHHHHHTPARHLPEIENLIKQANLPQKVQEWSLAGFSTTCDRRRSRSRD